MPTLTIDNRDLTVASGTKVIEAAEQIGIMIPRFCYHPALGSVGACRVCAVKVIEGYCPGIQMSCMIEARDGMVVSTIDAEAVDFRRHVIEWLMVNHPHDCPVCDEGGHCLLQDMTVSGGHGLRRYNGNKRTHRDQFLGPLIQHEMNRCIQCYRCTRFYREFAGYEDLGVMGIASRVYFGRKTDGPLESPFAGNLVDICPTGVYTDKPSRYKGRRWDFQRSPSICISCSLGCNTTVSARYREVVRTEARYNPAVNGHFICDRGRYDFDYVGDPERPREAMIGGSVDSMGTVKVEMAKRLEKIEKTSGPSTIALAGSTRCSLETLSAAANLCRQKKWHNPVFYPDAASVRKAITVVSRMEPETNISMRDIRHADFILVIGVDPVNEAPMLTLTLREARRNGADVTVVDPRPVDLPFDFHHMAVAPEEFPGYLGSFLKSVVAENEMEGLDRDTADFYESLKSVDIAKESPLAPGILDFKHSRQPALVCGTGIVPETTVSIAADGAALLKATKDRAGLFYLLPGPNAFSAGLASTEDDHFDRLVKSIETGDVRALILVETDPYSAVTDRHRLETALGQLDLLVVMDYKNSESVKRADIFLPTSTIFESGGHYINQEGRLQKAIPSFSGGQTILETGMGDHPPRSYSSEIPGGNPETAERLLGEIGGISTQSGDDPATCIHRLLGNTSSANRMIIPEPLPEEGFPLRLDQIRKSSGGPSC